MKTPAALPAALAAVLSLSRSDMEIVSLFIRAAGDGLDLNADSVAKATAKDIRQVCRGKSTVRSQEATRKFADWVRRMEHLRCERGDEVFLEFMAGMERLRLERETQDLMLQ